MRFSIIIPLYNKAPYIRKALLSVCAQSFTDYEVVVVDDGSQDGSADIVEQVIKETHLPAILMNQPNAGVSTARNNGVRASHGEYICFLDADDWWESDFLQEMNQLISRYPDAGIYGTNYYIVKNHQKRVAPIGIDSTFEHGYINYCQVYSKTLCMPLTSISVALRRDIFDEFQGFKPQLRLGEDFDLWIRITLKYKVAFLNKPLCNYNQDVDLAFRGTRRIHDPKYHMLWNLDYLEPQESTNRDYKQLIDNLRTNGLWKYFLSKEYHAQAVAELKKVDWSQQSPQCRRRYQAPLCWSRLCFWLRIQGSRFKQLLIKMKQSLLGTSKL